MQRIFENFHPPQILDFIQVMVPVHCQDCGKFSLLLCNIQSLLLSWDWKALHGIAVHRRLTREKHSSSSPVFPVLGGPFPDSFPLVCKHPANILDVSITHFPVCHVARSHPHSTSEPPSTSICSSPRGWMWELSRSSLLPLLLRTRVSTWTCDPSLLLLHVRLVHLLCLPWIRRSTLDQ